MFGHKLADTNEALYRLENRVKEHEANEVVQTRALLKLKDAYDALFDEFARIHGYVAASQYSILSQTKQPISPREFSKTTNIRLAVVIPEGHPK